MFYNLQFKFIWWMGGMEIKFGYEIRSLKKKV